MSQFLIFVRSKQVSIVGSIWDGFHPAMPDSRMPEESEIPRAVDSHRLLEHPAPSDSVAPAPRTIVGCGTEVDFSAPEAAQSVPEPVEPAQSAPEETVMSERPPVKAPPVAPGTAPKVKAKPPLPRPKKMPRTSAPVKKTIGKR